MPDKDVLFLGELVLWSVKESGKVTFAVFVASLCM